MFWGQRNGVFPWTLACAIHPHRVKHLIRVMTRTLPNNHPFIVQKEYIIAFVDEWEVPAQALFISTADKLTGLTLRCRHPFWELHPWPFEAASFVSRVLL